MNGTRAVSNWGCIQPPEGRNRGVLAISNCDALFLHPLRPLCFIGLESYRFSQCIVAFHYLCFTSWHLPVTRGTPGHGGPLPRDPGFPGPRAVLASLCLAPRRVQLRPWARLQATWDKSLASLSWEPGPVSCNCAVSSLLWWVWQSQLGHRASGVPECSVLRAPGYSSNSVPRATLGRALPHPSQKGPLSPSLFSAPETLHVHLGSMCLQLFIDKIIIKYRCNC